MEDNALIETILPNALTLLAQAKQSQGPSSFMPMIMMGAIIFIMYFLMIRPQKKQQQERQKMMDSLQKGDKIITTGGIYGTIAEMSDTSIKLRIAEGVVIRISRAAIAGKTQKDAD